MFGQYLGNHRPPLSLARCSGAHVLEFLCYLNQFGHPSPPAKVHAHPYPFFGHPSPPAPCPCPLPQAWGSLDAFIGRLCTAFEENEGKPESNPFGALPSDFTSTKSAIHSSNHWGLTTRRRRGAHPITLPISAVRFKNPSDLGDGCRSDQMNLRKIRDSQSKARGISYEKKKWRPPVTLLISAVLPLRLQSSHRCSIAPRLLVPCTHLADVSTENDVEELELLVLGL
ncbi:hypothetical protein RJ640_010417 [Escallonia rubra]|uniref:ALOG domain-containing protein n=1 Tax=Escallonia rubra TaxID=112253 RepID=A0AA88QRC2_9ASTE|nr:hypothetical protein RJ640_010417 [Escallonia rubra]